MPLHRTWITASRDYKINVWDINKDQPIVYQYFVHTDSIMDACEISSPLSIATCSLDRTIVLYNIIEGFKVRTIAGDHQKGIKKLSYCPQHGGYLVSIGNEVMANVWGAEAVVSEVLLGQLKGHSRPLIDTKFIGKSLFNVTADETNEIRIWNVKSCSCI